MVKSNHLLPYFPTLPHLTLCGSEKGVLTPLVTISYQRCHPIRIHFFFVFLPAIFTYFLLHPAVSSSAFNYTTRLPWMLLSFSTYLIPIRMPYFTFPTRRDDFPAAVFVFRFISSLSLYTVPPFSLGRASIEREPSIAVLIWLPF